MRTGSRAGALIDRLHGLDSRESDFRFHPAASDLASELAILLEVSDEASEIETRIRGVIETRSESTRTRAALVLAAGRSQRAPLATWLADLIRDPRQDALVRRAAVLAIGPITNLSARRSYTVGEFLRERGAGGYTFRTTFARGPLEESRIELFTDIALHDDDLELRELCVLTLGQAIDHDPAVRATCLRWLDLEANSRTGLWDAAVFVTTHGQHHDLHRELTWRLASLSATGGDEARLDICRGLAQHQLAPTTLSLLLDAANDARLSHAARLDIASRLSPVLTDQRFVEGAWRALVGDALARLGVREPDMREPENG